MLMRLLTGLVLAVFVASIAWFFRDTPTVQKARPHLEAGLAKVGVDTATVRRYWPLAGERATTSSASAKTTGVLASPAGVHKCTSASGTVYTDLACPAGSKTQAVSKGSVTVLEASPAPAVQASAPPDPAKQAQTLRAQAIDRVIGQ
jgi:hypothetical protein